MKTKIKRHSRSVLSVVLALCMLLSCMTAGMIMTDAAKVDGDAVGASWTDHVNLKLYVAGTTDEAWTDISAINVHKTINFGNLRRNDLSIQIKADGNNEVYWLASENGAVSGNVGSGFENRWWKPNQSSVSVVSFDADCDYEVWWNQSDGSHGIQLNIKKVVGNQIWTVVGNNEDIFGGQWNTGDATHTANDMTYDSSSEKYVKKYSNVALTAGSFQYKIVKDHAWGTEVPSGGGNQTCSVPANGHYDIRFEYDGSTLTCTLTALHQLTASTTDNSDYSLRVSGSTDISNVSGGINSGYYPENSTATVKVIPADNTKKVSKIVIGSNEYTPTNNGNGTYTYSFSVTADKTISAILVDKTNYTVSFSANPAAQGTVTAVDENGTEINSGDSVLEGTKVTFTASPNDGYVLSNWSGSFSDKLSTVTKTITADTTATANFAKQGYKIVYDGAYGANGKSMTEMPNGKFISSVPVGNSLYFRILDTGKNAISKSTGTPQSLSADKEYGVNDWVTAPEAWNPGDSFSNSTGANAYVVYDPANDTVYLTGESDGMFSSYEVYIKDGTVRYLDNTWDGFSADYGTTTLESNGTTSGVTASPVTGNYNNHVKKITLTAAQVRNGVDLHIKTVVKSAYQSSYYVTGFDVNGGLTQALISQEFDDDGDAIAPNAYEDVDAGAKIHTSHSNDFILKVTGEKFPDQKIEVTPIYFPLVSKDTDFVRFYAYDFTEDVKRDWGGSLAVYPYIEGKYAPYGKYPGQLMVNEGGVYYADIPAKHSDGTPIQGLTMNNYVWDALHYNLFYGSNQTGNNWQTYDYNEFTVINDILQNTPGLENEDIIFSFKYKETVARKDSNLGESTYYKDSDTNNPNRDKDYRNGFQTIEVNDSQYDWEDLTDFYGNKVDIFDQLVEIDGNETKMGYNPIRIISNGYDDNLVGYYATAWALYKPVDASGHDAWTGTVDHYELFDVIGGQGRNARDFQSESFLIARASQKQVRMKYDGAYHNRYWGNPDYPQSQLILDAANVPVEITYEYNVQANKSNINSGPDQLGYRSDGRWYYSDKQQFIKANAIVEVANSKAGPFSRDYFQEDNYDYKSGTNYNPALNTGLNTRVKAYFTNDDLVEKQSIQYQNVNGYTLAHAISDGEHSFSLKAEEDPDGNYMFVGWYRLTENGTGVGYSLASEDMEFSTEAKTNDVYVARFVKVPAGNVVITHTLASGSTGTATCWAKAEIYSDSACTNAVDTTTYGTFTEDAIKVNSKYIKSTSENYLKITLKTVLGDSTSFVKFQEKVQNTVNALTAGNDQLGISATVTVDTSGPDMYATITFPISALFTTTSGETEQTVKNLPFYSLSNQKNYAHTKILYSPGRSVSGGIDEAIGTYGAEAVLSAFTRDYYQPGNVDWTSASGYDKTDVTGLNTEVQAYMTSGGNNVTELDFEENDVITLNAVDTSSVNQSRYSFVGWFVQKTDGTIEKLSNSSYTAAAADKDLVFLAVFEPVLTYVLKYTYDSTHYGSQFYLVTGVFTTQEIEDYLVWSNTDPSAEGLSGSYAYNSEKKAEFFASKSPYEKNIGKTFHWEFTNDTTSFYSNNHQLSSTIPSLNGTDTQRKIQFVFPYRVISTNDGIESQKTDDKVVIVPNGEHYKEGQYSRYLTITSATYGQPYALNWEVNTSGEQVDNYVTAEEKIFDSSNVEYHFAYWSIKNIPVNVRTSNPNASDVITEYDKQVEVARCYNLGFNFTIYQDYIVEPVYKPSTSQIPKIHSKSATIAFTEYGRNQWNENGGGNSVPATQKVQGDKIFLQFMTAYDREDMIRLDSQTAITAGILYERLDQLTDAQKENMPSPVDLFNSYGTADPTHGKAAAEAAVASTTSTTVGKEKYAILKLDTAEKLQKIDNKNRIALEQGVTHKNKDGQETGYANYIYRAYAYMVEENGTVTISDQPVYFTFYTIANMANGSNEG